MMQKYFRNPEKIYINIIYRRKNIYNQPLEHRILKDDISQHLIEECEIFEEINGIKTHIGIINDKILFYFAIEFLKFSIDNYLKESKHKKFFSDNILELNKWMDEDCEHSILADYDGFFCLERIKPIEKNMTKAIDHCFSMTRRYSVGFHYICVSSTCNDIYRDFTKDNDGIIEFSRQSNFILDFLKSGKHLFMV